MELKYETKSVIKVNYNDLDKFLTKRFDLPEDYKVASIEELSNDVVKSIDVNKEDLDEYDLKDLNATLIDKEPELYSTGILLCHLCGLGEIPEGEYFVEVSW